MLDEFGLTPLHYAVWNGHVECVKLLVCNTLGVDKDGNRASSLSITSCLGFTGDHKYRIDIHIECYCMTLSAFRYSAASCSFGLTQEDCTGSDGSAAASWPRHYGLKL